MPYYESVFIARQDVSAPQVDSFAEDFSKTIGEQGGKVTKKEYWGLKNLAYKIKKNRKGHYVMLNIDAPSDAIQEMERQMRLNEDVLRFLTVRVDELDEGPSIMMQRGSGREERGRRDGRPRHDDEGRSRRDGGRPRHEQKDKGPVDADGNAPSEADKPDAPADDEPAPEKETKTETKDADGGET